MTDNQIFNKLAAYYDLIYKDKNYEQEANFIEQCFAKHSFKPKKILEVGCGTGNYSKIFSKKGYDVTGVDSSEEMLTIARKKCPCSFIRGDIKSVSLLEKFDCCLALFNVIGYVTDNSSITKTLTKIRSHLRRGALFIFDVWNGLAVVRHLPENRVKKVENSQTTLVRYAYPTLKSVNHICEVNYKIVIKEKQPPQSSEFREKHLVRFFFPQEIKHYIEENGFQTLNICPFMDLDGKVTEDVWNMTIIAKVE